MEQILGSSITYRIAVGPLAKVARYSRYERLPACEELFDDGVGKEAGFSLHAGVAARADQRQKLERLCRYISRPAISEERLSLTPNGNVRYQLKTPYRDGTTHVIFEPLDFSHENQVWAVLPAARQWRWLAACTETLSTSTPLTRSSGAERCSTATPLFSIWRQLLWPVSDNYCGRCV